MSALLLDLCDDSAACRMGRLHSNVYHFITKDGEFVIAYRIDVTSGNGVWDTYQHNRYLGCAKDFDTALWCVSTLSVTG